jgi:hypothetical protein
VFRTAGSTMPTPHPVRRWRTPNEASQPSASTSNSRDSRDTPEQATSKPPSPTLRRASVVDNAPAGCFGGHTILTPMADLRDEAAARPGPRSTRCGSRPRHHRRWPYRHHQRPATGGADPHRATGCDCDGPGSGDPLNSCNRFCATRRRLRPTARGRWRDHGLRSDQRVVTCQAPVRGRGCPSDPRARWVDHRACVSRSLPARWGPAVNDGDCIGQPRDHRCRSRPRRA